MRHDEQVQGPDDPNLIQLDAMPCSGFRHTPTQRQGKEEALTQATVQQLTRMFGVMASRPTVVHLKDWAFDEYTATALDRDPVIPRGMGFPH